MENDHKRTQRLIAIGWFIFVMLIFFVLLASTAQAAPLAQETATPTPETAYKYELSTGNYIQVERSISYGQIGIVAALGVVALLLVLLGLFQLISHYLY